MMIFVNKSPGMYDEICEQISCYVWCAIWLYDNMDILALLHNFSKHEGTDIRRCCNYLAAEQQPQFRIQTEQ